MKKNYFLLGLLCFTVFGFGAVVQNPGDVDTTFNPTDIGFNSGEGTDSIARTAAISSNKKAITYAIKEAYLIDNQGQGQDIMEAILKTNAFIYSTTNETTDSTLFIVSTHEKQVFIIGRGLPVSEKESYMDLVRYKDEKGDFVSPDMSLLIFYKMNTNCGLFPELKDIETIICREELTQLTNSQGNKLFLFTFFINDTIIQIYAYENSFE